MVDVNAQLRLINGIRELTRNTTLTWDSKERGRRSNPYGIGLSIMRLVQGGATYTAKSSKRLYEITSGDSIGRAPYELTVWDLAKDPNNPAIAISSATSPFGQEVLVNRALQDLYEQVKGTVETDDELVDRLLRDP